ncbi:aquaporin [Kineococcus aurantiacus]|uniref:Glycerol uptake facilitator-like aquaporin n=1 Tax=Kineococcus aurantiacus TaxID=37633 RepID=A0A7Y9AU25_9ACTN|nr:glycerol uptake facilitator-like aquaporin [Kineococcus aurantiacus]
MTVPLPRRLLAEFLGTGLLVAVVVGSGTAAQRLSPDDVGLQLLENSTATVLGLAVLILLFGPVSGAHFNPVVTLADWALGRRAGTGLRGQDVLPYLAAQTAGAVGGSLLANAMFDLPVLQTSDEDRTTSGHLLAEVVATAVLVLLVFALARTGRAAIAAPAVGAYVGAAYWFTSSTSFANPAVTVGRVFTDTFAGIAPASAAAFTAAQLVGGVVGAGVLLALHPTAGAAAGDVLVPHPQTDPDTQPDTQPDPHPDAETTR